MNTTGAAKPPTQPAWSSVCDACVKTDCSRRVPTSPGNAVVTCALFKPPASDLDKAKRDAAVDELAAAVKRRLDEQAAKGYTGWDSTYPRSSLLAAIMEDGKNIRYNLEVHQFEDRAACRRRIVDIVARCMMLNHRLQEWLRV